MSGKSLINPALRAVAHLRSSALPKNVTKSAAAFLSAAPSGGAHTLPDLPYNYDALEPVISSETMTIHHTKHHNTYVTNINASLEKLDSAVSAGDVGTIIGLLCSEIQWWRTPEPHSLLGKSSSKGFY